MRFFELLNFQYVIVYAFPGLVFIILLGILLGYNHFTSENGEVRKIRIRQRYPGGIESQNQPFPLGLILIIAGTFIWGFLYILFHGLLGVKI